MLNSPGEEVAAPPETANKEKSEVSPLIQIGLIGGVGLYLFGIVWIYAHLPILALAGTLVAAGFIIAGLLRRMRDDDSAGTGC
ncbi:MAG: hypothetical protein OES99_02050 [Gammaproteobacteria bacterium]|nr:hypothetical protein [Gammaproteobacteria bacterium]